ncbi:hypothetical protein AN958_11436 [Leucoagaricus sp. SymC.cos]|nr:hypothetical protein AN958_11436 [Leucoagaricus sp. SymC.cos]
MRFYNPPSCLYSPFIMTNLLRLLWVVLILWSEVGVYFWSLSTCRWPVHKSEQAPGDALHALLISDTQISTPSLSRESASLFPHPRKLLSEKFLKKSWSVTRRLNPHVVFFLGDMLAHGKYAQNEAQFAELAQKFKSTFPLNTSTLIYHLPGNNDVGNQFQSMGLVSAQTQSIRTCFQRYFSPLNSVITLKNHTFFVLDAPGLVDEDYQRNARGASFSQWESIPGGAVEAVRNVAAREEAEKLIFTLWLSRTQEYYQPLILLSHIPLYRPDGAPCGPLRERGTIDRGVGRGYQNTLGKQTTAFVMKALEPSVVFSGDNRDYCEYVHRGTSFDVAGQIPEITVKSFSPAPHIRRPGFQLLSIVDPINLTASKESQSLLHRPCLLPDQTIIFAGYFWWTITTLCILFILNVRRIRQFRLTKAINPSLTPSPTRSHQTSPLHQDTSDTLSSVWSPHTPFPLNPPKSPRGLMPTTFRTPVAPATQTFRASSRPMTPNSFGESMLSPQLIPPMHDDEDSLFPDQYTIQRGMRHLNDEECRPIGREEFLEPGSELVNGTPANTNVAEPRAFSSPSQFISAPKSASTHPRRQSTWKLIWSKTFVLGGRRRVFRIHVPRMSAWWVGFTEILEVLRDADQRTLLRRRRGIVASTLVESVSIFWPAGIVWLVINCWMF